MDFQQYNDLVSNEINLSLAFETDDVKSMVIDFVSDAITYDSILHEVDTLTVPYIKIAVSEAAMSYLKGGYLNRVGVVGGDVLSSPAHSQGKKLPVYKIGDNNAVGFKRYDVFKNLELASLLKVASEAQKRGKHTRDRSLFALVSMLEKGSTTEQAASVLGVSIATVGNWMTHLAGVASNVPTSLAVVKKPVDLVDDLIIESVPYLG